jgi:cobalt-zinc-cadmium efflux system membrane fusion protein
MGSWLGRFTGGLRSWVPTVLVLALLGALAVWGAQSDWEVGKFAEVFGEPEAKAEEPEKVTVKDVPLPAGAESAGAESQPAPVKQIVFPSADLVRKTGIQTEPAKVRPMRQYVTANGMLDYVPKLYAQLSSPVNGKIWRVEKEFGETVRKGDVLVVIDSAEVGKAKADLIQSLTMHDVRTTELSALEAARASVPAATLRKARAALREARGRLFNDHQQLLNLGLPIRLKELMKMSDEERVSHLRLLDLPEEVRRQVDKDTLTANLLPLRAPFDGQVVRHPQAAAGEVVNTSRPHTLFVVADVRHLHIELEVHLEDVAPIRLGQTVTFRPENKGGAVARGEVSHISPEVSEKTRRVLVHAEVDNPDGRLRPNIYGTGSILIRERKGAVTVPTTAIQEMEESPLEGQTPAAPAKPGGRTYLVFIRLPGSETTFESRPVTLGIREGKYTEVTGVKAGELVVTTGGHALKSEILKERIEGGD